MRSRSLMVVLGLLLVACGSGTRADAGPIALDVDDPLGADRLFAALQVDGLIEVSNARVLADDVETFGSDVLLRHQRTPRAFDLDATFRGGGPVALARDSGSLAVDGHLHVVGIDGLLHQDVGEGWNADGFVGSAIAQGPSAIVVIDQLIASTGVEDFVPTETVDIAGLAAQGHRAEGDAELLSAAWSAVIAGSGGLAPSLPPESIVTGFLDVFIADGDAVVSWQLSIGANLDGQVVRSTAFAELADLRLDTPVQVP